MIYVCFGCVISYRWAGVQDDVERNLLLLLPADG